MNTPSLQIGMDDFRMLRKSGAYFVDKSLFISKILRGKQTTLLPRPRRFGKTTNMSMMAAYLDCQQQDQDTLFAGLKVLAEGPDVLAHKGSHPVIFLSLKEWKFSALKDLKQQLVDEMAGLLASHPEVLPCLNPTEKRFYDNICDGLASLGILQKSLKLLCGWLKRAHGGDAVILIDEYDTPLLHAHSEKYFDGAVKLLRPWLGAALKGNPFLFKGVLTGILRIAKESLFSGLNNLQVSSVINPLAHAQDFGFTDDEVKQILTDFSLSDRYPDIKAWYNGYAFGDDLIYNPWSICCYLDEKCLKPYWLNTSDNALIFESLRKAPAETRAHLQQLLEGAELRLPIREDTVMADIIRDPTCLWSFFVATGYLKADQAQPDITLQYTYRLRIPNLEVRQIFTQFIQQEYLGPLGHGINPVLEAIIADDAPKLEQSLNQVFLQIVGIHDVAKEPEAFLHGFFLALAACLGDRFTIASNQEAGLGRADLILIPRPESKLACHAKIFEFKSIKRNDKVAAALKAAFAQIEARDYAAKLHHLACPGITQIALVQQGKKLFIEMKEG